jgi:hypothetical protein
MKRFESAVLSAARGCRARSAETVIRLMAVSTRLARVNPYIGNEEVMSFDAQPEFAINTLSFAVPAWTG